MITDINEVYPLTIVAREQFKPEADNNYYAFNYFQGIIPSMNTWERFEDSDGEFSYISTFDYWLEVGKPIYGKGNSIKEACKDLVRKLNEKITYE